MERTFKEKLILWIAEGFGAGKIRFAPGTWGSVVGLLWIGVLLLPNNLWIYGLGTIGGFLVAVYTGGEAERILNEKDPGRIVVDEIAAMPVAFAGCLLFEGGNAPPFLYFFEPGKWHLVLATFLFFRLFDILKPIGIRRSQNLPGGWGLAIDDILAAALVIPVVAVLSHWH
jgi:phosphatidylglycerophosphatase A